MKCVAERNRRLKNMYLEMRMRNDLPKTIPLEKALRLSWGCKTVM